MLMTGEYNLAQTDGLWDPDTDPAGKRIEQRCCVCGDLEMCAFLDTDSVDAAGRLGPVCRDCVKRDWEDLESRRAFGGRD